MIYALFLLDAMGFSLMEVFTEEFFSLKISKKDVFQALNSFTMENLTYTLDDFVINFVKVDNNHAVGLCVDKEIQADNSLMSELVEISKRIIQGDKNAIHKVMGIKRAKEIEFLQV